MTRQRDLPDTASIAHKSDNGRLCAPSALRNVDAILNVLGRELSGKGTALEIASGTGEHILRFGQAFPDIKWQPSEVAPERRESIQAWQAHDGGPNVMVPIDLDATEPGWSDKWNGYDAIVLSNLLHLISKAEAGTVVSEAARSLAPGGACLFYGPFKRGEKFASESDKKFHESLSGHDIEIGYKSFEQVQTWQSSAGLNPSQPIEMPANNLMLFARKPL